MKKTLLKLFTVILFSILSITVSVSAADASQFTDVNSHWAAASLKKAVADGVLNGSGNKLNPNGNLKGSEMAAILVRKTDAQKWSQPYPGTSSTDWYYMTSAVAMEAEILPEDGSVPMGSAVTREQVFLSFAKAYHYDLEMVDTSVLERYTDGYLLGGEYARAAAALTNSGILTGNDEGKLNPQKQITRAEFVTMLYRYGSYAASNFRISLTAPDVKAGGSLQAKAGFKNASQPRTCDLQWYLDGKPVSGYSAAGKVIDGSSSSSFTQKLTFTKNMSLSHRIGLGVDYTDEQTGETVKLYTEKTVRITNYSASHYNPPAPPVDTSLYKKALSTVTTKYKGNYTSSYNIDYSKGIKEAFVNAKGYSSKTKYLVWTNLATQKVNIFTGSKGHWKLAKTFRCASGARSTPTPTGVTYVTYKQAGWYTKSYTCRPIVRFYPGTGYAFHSMLYYPGTNKLKDASMGFPVSHGCIRMQDAGIYWIYNNVPVNSTVVIY